MRAMRIKIIYLGKINVKFCKGFDLKLPKKLPKSGYIRFVCPFNRKFVITISWWKPHHIETSTLLLYDRELRHETVDYIKMMMLTWAFFTWCNLFEIKYSLWLYGNIPTCARSVLRTLPNICDRAFCENS